MYLREEGKRSSRTIIVCMLVGQCWLEGLSGECVAFDLNELKCMSAINFYLEQFSGKIGF